ncbi:MAG: ABC-type transport auxiliary lipoprotein family protein [Byssovorax sp.]
MRASLGRTAHHGARRGAWLLGAVAALLTAGCALTEKSTPIMPRYFSPERPAEATRPSAAPPEAPLELRLGRVYGSSHLDERLVYRDSDYQLGYYEERRWTEEPAEYLRRRLARVLFEERGLKHVVGGLGPSLEVELTGFEEIRAPKRVARVQMTARLQDARVVRWEETLTVDQPIAENAGGDVADSMVAAMGVALSTAVDRIATRVVADLSSTPPPAPSTLPAAPPPPPPHAPRR